jgi:hypothetical protein
MSERAKEITADIIAKGRKALDASAKERTESYLREAEAKAKASEERIAALKQKVNESSNSLREQILAYRKKWGKDFMPKEAARLGLPAFKAENAKRRMMFDMAEQKMRAKISAMFKRYSAHSSAMSNAINDLDEAEATLEAVGAILTVASRRK